MNRMMIGCVAAAARILASDSFDRANSTNALGNADSGQTWTNSAIYGNALGINGNAAYNAATVNGAAVLSLGAANVLLEMVVGAFAAYMGFAFRFVDASNYCIAEFRNANPGFVVAGKVSGAAFGGSSASGYYLNGLPTMVAGDRLKIVANGTTITVYVNDVSYGSLTITQNATATKHGIRITGSVARINSFLAKRV